MSSPSKQQKSRRFVTRVTAANGKLTWRAAAIEGHSAAKFVIPHARGVARRVVNEDNLIQLNADKSVRFVEAMLAPPRPPTSTMVKSIRAYRESVKSDLD